MYPQTLLGVLNPQAAMPVNWDTGEILQAEKHKATAGQGKEPALFVDTVCFCCK